MSNLDARLNEILSAPPETDKFSVAHYLNTALEETEPDDNNDAGYGNTSTKSRRMAELALQLQLCTQSCHDDISKIGAELQAILPRCVNDMSRLDSGLQGLHADTTSLLDAVQQPNSSSSGGAKDVTTSLETLATLHHLQANLTHTKTILQAAATWDATLAQLPPLLQAHQWTAAVQAVQQLQHGEQALSGMPRADQRQAAVAKARTQTLQLLQPQLQHALSHMSSSSSRLGPLQQVVTWYDALGENATLEQEYVKMRPAALHKAWFDYQVPMMATTNNNNNAVPLVDWLPTWLDTLLTTLTEERRQATTIFGVARVPQVLLQVLHAALHPLPRSWSSRLDSVCSLQHGSSSGSSTSLAALTQLYQATLKFAMEAYELVAGCWWDAQEKGGAVTNSGDSDGGWALWQQWSKVLTLLMAPYEPYQHKLPTLERSLAEPILQTWTKQLEQLVQTATTTPDHDGTVLDGLSAFMEGLLQSDVVTAVVPVVALEMLSRFELLRCGHGVGPSMSSLDQIVALHVQRVTETMQKLSTAIVKSTNKAALVQAFDDSHVQTALQSLQIAGRLVEATQALEQETKARLDVLATRMAERDGQDRQFAAAASAAAAVVAEGTPLGSTTTKTAIMLPDSISIVELDSIVTKHVFGQDDDDTVNSRNDINAAYSLLQGLASSDDPVLSQTLAAAGRLMQSCQTLVFDTCSIVPRHHLAGMASLPCWKAANPAVGEGDAYGTLPQSYMTQVGEHMLALVQAIEPFAANNDALQLAQHAMSDVKRIALVPWKDFLAAVGTGGLDGDDETVITDKLWNTAEVGSLLDIAPAEHEIDADGDGGGLNAATSFCNGWLDVVALAVTGRLLEQLLRVPSLSDKGCEHMAADIDYMANVLSALGVSGHPHPLLSHFSDLVALDKASLASRLASSKRPTEVVERVLRAAEQRLLAIRR